MQDICIDVHMSAESLHPLHNWPIPGKNLKFVAEYRITLLPLPSEANLIGDCGARGPRDSPRQPYLSPKTARCAGFFYLAQCI